MSRKQKPPPAPPSKAYLVSFGDTMTALLAFFIVLNSFAQEQTGAQMYVGTGSFVNAAKNIGLPGGFFGDKSGSLVEKEAPKPIYAFGDPDDEQTHEKQLGDDENPDDGRIVDRQEDNFKRFLTEMNRQFAINEHAPTKKQIVFDSFEKLNKPREDKDRPLKENAIQIASEAITKLINDDFEIEIVVWAAMPSRLAMGTAMETALTIEKQIDSAFLLNELQRSRLSVSAKPWLFSDAKRPKVSFVLSKMDSQ